MTAFNVDKTDINLESIDWRLRQLMDLDRATSYAKQKDSLRKEFETFLASYKTVDPYNGKVWAILHSIGRDGEWDKRLALGNPASDKSVWLVTAEKLKAQVTPKQATPFLRW